MHGTLPLQTGPHVYSSTGLNTTRPVWYSRPPPVINHGYTWNIDFDDKYSLNTPYQHLVSFPPTRSPIPSLPYPLVDVAHPKTPHQINAGYLEYQPVLGFPEMVFPSLPHPLYHHPQQILWPTTSEYEYENVSYPETHIEAAGAAGYYYSPPQTSHHNGGAYSTYLPYTHMKPYSINSTPATGHVLNAPISSNPSSGATSSQLKSLDAQYECGHIDSTNSTEALLTPIPPTILHHPHVLTGMTPEPLHPSHQQEALTPFQPQLVHHEIDFQAPSSSIPPSPISPVSGHPLAINQVVLDAPTPTTAASHSTIFVMGSGQEEAALEISPVLVKSQAQPAEKLKKSRGRRRDVIACVFCRGRKVCFCLHFSILGHPFTLIHRRRAILRSGEYQKRLTKAFPQA
jgi:hypothetical protein